MTKHDTRQIQAPHVSNGVLHIALSTHFTPSLTGRGLDQDVSLGLSVSGYLLNRGYTIEHF